MEYSVLLWGITYHEFYHDIWTIILLQNLSQDVIVANGFALLIWRRWEIVSSRSALYDFRTLVWCYVLKMTTPNYLWMNRHCFLILIIVHWNYAEILLGGLGTESGSWSPILNRPIKEMSNRDVMILWDTQGTRDEDGNKYQSPVTPRSILGTRIRLRFNRRVKLICSSYGLTEMWSDKLLDLCEIAFWKTIFPSS